MVSIALACKAPKKLKGEHQFSSFKELYIWVSRNFKDPSYANHLIINVAENGVWSEAKYGRVIEISSGSKLGYRAKEIARDIGLLHTKWGSDRYSERAEKELEFAEAIDKILS